MKKKYIHKVVLALGVAASAYSVSAATVQTTTFATSGVSTSPDSLTSDGTSLYVQYGNGVSSTGSDGRSSTIVRYGFDGSVQNTYSVLGSVDGLKFNPFTNQLWALQNQDGNSTLTIINPSNGVQTRYSYPTSTLANAAFTSDGNHGFDDAVFTSTGAYLSRTNPTMDPTQAVLVFSSLTGTTVNLSPVLLYGAAPNFLNDPDSLKQDGGGNLVLTSGDDGATVTIFNPNTVGQSLRTLQLTDLSAAPFSGLDDTAFTTATAGTLYVTDTRNNVVLALKITGLTGATEFASSGSLNTVGTINPLTGALTPIGNFAANASPHGLLFVPTPEPGTLLFGLCGLSVLAFLYKQRYAR